MSGGGFLQRVAFQVLTAALTLGGRAAAQTPPIVAIPERDRRTAAARPGSASAVDGTAGLPTSAELRELVAAAESVAVSPHGVRLESFRGDTINGVFLVDSDLPSARHVAFGKDAHGYRYVWFSRKNPLRASVVAMYQIDRRGTPDVLYWRQVDFETKIARAREFRGPAAGAVSFDYSSGPPCGKAVCEGWRDLPLERVQVAARFFQPLTTLFQAAGRHGEPHLDKPTTSLQPST